MGRDYYGSGRNGRRTPAELAGDRPAESATGAVGLVVAAAALIFDVELDPAEVAVVVAAVAALPALVTKLVEAVRSRFS